MGGATALSLAPPAFANVKPGRWVRYESPNFICFSAADETKTRNEVLALEKFHALLTKIMPRNSRSPLKLTIYMVNTDRDFERTQPQMGSSVSGFYDASVEQVRAVSSSDRSQERQRDMKNNIRAMDARVVLFHEYAHHFVAANNRTRYPRWYNEGFAEFISSVSLDEKEMRVGMFTRNRAAWLLTGDWLEIDKFLNPRELDGEETAMFYAQAWLATHMLFMRPERAAGFDRYCKAMETGQDVIAAFQPSFGISADEFDKELRRYRREAIKILHLPYDAAAVPAITIQRLTSGADELLAAMSYLRAVPPRSDSKDTVELVRREAAKHPADPYALKALAHVEVWYGDLAKARTQLDALLAAHGADAEVHHLSGLCDLRQAYKDQDKALFTKARGAFTQAHSLDGTRAMSLFRYMEADLNVEGRITEHMAEVLLMAYEIAPQVQPIALVTAQALMQLELWKDALFILEPLATSAHAEQSERVRPILEAARAKQPLTFMLFGSAALLSDESE